MEQIVTTKSLHLPENLVCKIDSDEVILREVPNGILVVPFRQKTVPLYGMFRDKGFTVDAFLEQKRADKELEK
ncbi:MAG: hypothetical protein LBU99_04670 [Spirochaetaceae bacterium]|jgi:hypothetical protein|nr:hypothetical protein [Spirochaetaceae bacterium]